MLHVFFLQNLCIAVPLRAKCPHPVPSSVFFTLPFVARGLPSERKKVLGSHLNLGPVQDPLHGDDLVLGKWQ